MKNHFQKNFKKLRQRAGTQVKVADDLIISPKTLAAYEEGRGTPDYNRLIAISQYFNITIDSLLKEEL